MSLTTKFSTQKCTFKRATCPTIWFELKNSISLIHSFFVCKSVLYKNVQAEICQMLMYYCLLECVDENDLLLCNRVDLMRFLKDLQMGQVVRILWLLVKIMCHIVYNFWPGTLLWAGVQLCSLSWGELSFTLLAICWSLWVFL